MKAHFNRPALEGIHRRCLDLGERKSHDYGAVGDAIAMGGVRGVIVRNLDKQLRCMSLSDPSHLARVLDESLKDTLMDMINYATYAVALLEGTWGREPLPEDPDFHVVDENDQAHRAIKACKEAYEYLANNHLNTISSGSAFHKQFEDAVVEDLPF